MLKLQVPLVGTVHDPLGLLDVIVECSGYYKAVINDQLIGRIVGYAGKYDAPDGNGQLNKVGYEYFNFAKVEEQPVQLRKFAGSLRQVIGNYGWDIDTLIPAPMGGLSLATITALEIEANCYYPEKKVLEVGRGGKRDQTELRWDRHKLPSGRKVAIVEDVINNMSTTGAMIDLIEAQGSEVVAILCGLLRAEDTFYDHRGRRIPIGSAIHRITPQFLQHDSEVAASIASGDVEWKAKDNWDSLLAELQTRYYTAVELGHA